mmetsp:Transcript_23081/g.43948  ORF Transcript_23081/g.43948 Transcript_23081/m.43948 type:complete len:282 (-) Transcript_23081:149-994(-)
MDVANLFQNGFLGGVTSQAQSEMTRQTAHEMRIGETTERLFANGRNGLRGIVKFEVIFNGDLIEPLASRGPEHGANDFLGGSRSRHSFGEDTSSIYQGIGGNAFILGSFLIFHLFGFGSFLVGRGIFHFLGVIFLFGRIFRGLRSVLALFGRGFGLFLGNSGLVGLGSILGSLSLFRGRRLGLDRCSRLLLVVRTTRSRRCLGGLFLVISRLFLVGRFGLFLVGGRRCRLLGGLLVFGFGFLFTVVRLRGCRRSLGFGVAFAASAGTSCFAVSAHDLKEEN